MKSYKHSSLLLSCLIIALTGLITACTDNGLRSERPERTGSNYVFEETTSSIALNVDIPYKIIQKAGEEQVNKFKNIPLDGSIDCTFKKHIDTIIGGGIGVKVPCSAGYKGNVNITRTQPFVVKAGPDNSLVATTTLSFNGYVGFKGDGAKLVGLDKKNVDGTITVTAVAKAGMNESWKPTADVKITHKWNKSPRIEALDGVYITFKEDADDMINDELKKLKGAIDEVLVKASIEQEVDKIWNAYAFQLPESTIDEPVTLFFTPKNAFFSGINATADRLRFNLVIEGAASVYLGKNAPDSKVGKLPALKMSRLNSNFILSLPILAEYQALTDVINASLADKKFRENTEFGRVDLTVTGIETFPSDNKLAIGVTFDADVEGEMMDVSGEVFLLGTPVISDNGTKVSLENVEFYRDLNNDLWNALSYVLRKNILDKLEKHAKYDLTKKIEVAYQAIDKQLPKIEKDNMVKITLLNKNIRLNTLGLDPRFLVVEGELSGNLIVEPTEINMK